MKTTEKIGAFYLKAIGTSTNDNPTFILDFDKLPQVIRLSLDLWIIAIDSTKDYKLHLKIYDDDKNNFVDDDSMVLKNDPDKVTPDNTFEGNLYGANFEITTQALTVLKNQLYTVSIELQDNDGKFLDKATTYFYAKLSHEQ